MLYVRYNDNLVNNCEQELSDNLISSQDLLFNSLHCMNHGNVRCDVICVLVYRYNSKNSCPYYTLEIIRSEN